MPEVARSEFRVVRNGDLGDLYITDFEARSNLSLRRRDPACCN
jgi:hypothetical protein